MKKNYLTLAKDVLDLEAQSIIDVKNRLTASQIDKTVELFEYLIESGNRLFFCGIGKSAIIGEKLAATFASIGLPSFFLHPVDALHGDIGRITKTDALCLISKSGNTEEILKLLPFITTDKIIGLIGKVDSVISKKCSILFDCSVEKEACINNQAPTTSTTVALAIGDALSVIFEDLTSLTREKFAVFHPGGILGKRLRFKVKDIMWDKTKCPILTSDKTLSEVILEMTRIPLGAVAITEGEKFLGIIVEGDIRRTLAKQGNLNTSVKDIMNTNPLVIGPNDLALSALQLMENRNKEISILPVVENQTFLGLLRLHDLLKEGF